MMDIDEAKAIMKGGLARSELEFIASITAPFYWIFRNDNGKFEAKNGTAFFLDAGEGPFGVTAWHVVDLWKEYRKKEDVIASQIGNELSIDMEERLIASHKGMDIATFNITAAEISSISKTVLTGHQKTWPPPPPHQNRGVYLCGFPEVERNWLSRNEISFGLSAGHGIASSINEKDISNLIERQHFIDVMGKGLPPENYKFSGISGGPLLTVVEHMGIRSWRLGGVIYQGPSTIDDENEAIAGLEIIKARRADFILPNGQLDIKRWESINFGTSADK